MSLVQQGTQTARNKKKAISTDVATSGVVPMAIRIWKREAHVLKKTCPAWETFVFGHKYPMAMPAKASGLTNHHFQ